MSLKIDIFFGSRSDEAVFNRLSDALSELNAEYNLEVCSAHRNPDRLRELVKSSSADLFIAGAGLSAHLPGAIAAHSLKPVIALPCQDVMKGLDALIASMQMPGGVPVLASGVENITSIYNFLSHYITIRESVPEIFIQAPASAAKLKESLEQFLKPYPFVNKDSLSSEALQISFVNLLEPETECFKLKNSICIPYLPEDKAWNPEILLELTAQGGLWVGINNYKNAALALLELWNLNQQWNNDLQCYREGVPAHV